MAGFQIKLAVICAKTVNLIIRKLFRRNGSVFPGYIARLIFPDILPHMAGMVRGGVIAVKGTNGKTTVNSLIYHILKFEGKTAVINGNGANMLNGVISAFVLAADNTGALSTDYACIEVDEFAAAQIFPLLRPDCVLLTNIFRDQMDRYGEMDSVCGKIRLALSMVPKTRLTINCDDFLSFTLARQWGGMTATYGINEKVFDLFSSPEATESTFCYFCGEKLEFTLSHYGQLGVYSCPSCGFRRPEPDDTASDVRLKDGRYLFKVDGISVISRADEPYNIYNTLAAYAALKSIGAPVHDFQKAVEAFEYGNRREEIFRINGARVRLCLAKNPVGLQQKISLMAGDNAPKDIVFQINDRAQDGRDVSWLWDVNFGYLKKSGAAAVFTTGTRRFDIALRMKYEDISSRPVRNLRKLLMHLSMNGTGNIYVIVNYSGLYVANRMLHKLQKKGNARKGQFKKK